MSDTISKADTNKPNYNEGFWHGMGHRIRYQIENGIALNVFNDAKLEEDVISEISKTMAEYMIREMFFDTKNIKVNIITPKK